MQPATTTGTIHTVKKTSFQFYSSCRRFYELLVAFKSVFLTLKGSEIKKKEKARKEEITIHPSNEHIKPRDSNELHPPYYHLISHFD